MIAITASSCKSKQQVAKVTGKQEVSIPFEKEGKNNSTSFLSSASAESPNVDFAKTMAINICRSRLAAEMKVVSKNAITNSRVIRTNTVGSDQKVEYDDKANDVISSISDRMLNNIDVTDSKTFYNADKNLYTVYVLMEAKRADVDAKIKDAFSNDEKLRQDFEFEKYKEEADKEFEKAKSQRNY